MDFEELTHKEKRACRAFRRLFAHRTWDWIKSQNGWEDADWESAWQTRADATAAYVGERFGMAVDRLLEAVSVLEGMEASLKHRP